MDESSLPKAAFIKPKRWKHGYCGSSEYGSWQHMKRRCLNPEHEAFKNYGGRGITVCERWIHSFSNFLTDMGPKPSPGHTIERSDNSKGYYPRNCKWATRREQQNNRRQNRNITIGSVTKTLTEWARDSGKRPRLIGQRISLGWDIRDALEAPVRNVRRLLDSEILEILALLSSGRSRRGIARIYGVDHKVISQLARPGCERVARLQKKTD